MTSMGSRCARVGKVLRESLPRANKQHTHPELTRRLQGAFNFRFRRLIGTHRVEGYGAPSYGGLARVLEAALLAMRFRSGLTWLL